jgi:hypothetical protein
MPINPIAARFQAVVARLQIEQQGDTPALAVEFTMLVGRHRYEADAPGVEAQGTVGIVLEYVGDDVGVAAVEDVLHRDTYQCHSEQKIAAVRREYGEAADLGNAISL